MDKELEQIFALCMEDIRRGISIEDCLARYPHVAKELEPLLRTTVIIHRTSHVPLRPEFKAAARSRLLASVKSDTSRPQIRKPIISWGWRWVTAFAVFVLVISGWGTVAMANNSLPDDTLYPVKIAAEEVKIALTPGSIRKARLAADMLDERTREIDELTKLDRVESFERANELLDRQLEWLTAMALNEEVASGQTHSELETLVASSADRQQVALEKALTKAPEKVKPALIKALQDSKVKAEAVRQQVEQKRLKAANANTAKAGSKAVSLGKAATSMPGSATPRVPKPAITPAPKIATAPAPQKAITPAPQKTAVPVPKTTPGPVQPTPSKTPVVTPRSTPKPATTPRPTPVPQPKGFIKSDDGLVYIECRACSAEELKQYLERVHKQALLEGKPFKAIADYAYTYEDKKLVKQSSKKLFRIIENEDASIRIEWECGACDARQLESLLKRIDDTLKAVVSATSPTKKPDFFYSVNPDGRRYNVVTLANKQQVNARRPALITSYPWPLDSSNELAYRTIITFSNTMRYTREDFIAEWLATWILKGMSDQQYNARLNELKSGKAYTNNVDSFNKTRLATDIVVALRAEGLNLDRIVVLLKILEGKNVNWKQFKDTVKYMIGKEAPTLNYIDRGVQQWKSRSTIQK